MARNSTALQSEIHLLEDAIFHTCGKAARAAKVEKLKYLRGELKLQEAMEAYQAARISKVEWDAYITETGKNEGKGKQTMTTMNQKLAAELTERVQLADKMATVIFRPLDGWYLLDHSTYLPPHAETPQVLEHLIGISYSRAVESLNRRYGLSLDPNRQPEL